MSSVPLIVKKYIDRHSVLTRPALATPQKNSARVEVAILHDELGKLQVFFAADTILDLGKIRQKLGREMKAISGKELKTILDKNGLASIPAFDMLLNMETIVDSRLLDYEKLTLYSGNLDEYFQVNDPKKLIQMASSKIEDICTELPDTNLNYENFYERDQHAINQSLSSFTILRIQKRLEETLELPPLPETARAIIELRSDPDADVDKLGKIVERDPSLAAQVVSWASSSYYSAPGNIKSIQDAIIRVLGYDLVMNQIGRAHV